MRRYCENREIESSVAMARRLARFVRTHNYVRAAFECLKASSEITFTLFPVTRFSYAKLIIDRVLKNMTFIDQLFDDDNWRSVTERITKSVVQHSEDDVKSNLCRRFAVIHDILRPVSLVIRHIEKQGQRASRVYLLGSSLIYNSSPIPASS